MSWQRLARLGLAGAVLPLAYGCGGRSASEAPIPPATTATDGAPPSDAADSSDAAIVGPNVCAVPPPGLQACSPTATCSDGSGYLVDFPSWCNVPGSAPRTFPSIADVTAALVGVWTSCGEGALIHLIDPNPNALGIELTSDSHFYLMGSAHPLDAQDFTLTRLPSPGDSGTPEGGTFEVVTATPISFSPSPYQLHLTAPDGYVYAAQIDVYAPGLLSVYLPTNEYYGLALTKSYQAHVCGPPLGSPDTPANYTDLIARLQGRWARCDDGIASSEIFMEFTLGSNLGLELTADGRWYQLDEDPIGNLVRETTPESFGTYAQDPAFPGSIDFIESTTGYPHWLYPTLDSCGGVSFYGMTNGSPSISLPSPLYRHMP
jgi:hypothetical protein